MAAGPIVGAVTDTHRAALDEALDRLRATGALSDREVDRAALRRSARGRAAELDLGLEDYLARLVDDPEEEARLVEALCRPGGPPRPEEVVRHLEEATEELEAANDERRDLTEDLATLGTQLDEAAGELDSVTAELDIRSRDVERLSAIVDGLVELHPTPAAAVDASLVVRAWSTALADLTDVAADDAVGRRLTQVSHLFPQPTVGVALRSLVNDAPTRSSVSTEVDWHDRAVVVAGTAVMDDDEVVAILVTASTGD